MFTPKFQETNTTLASEETQNVTAVANSTTVFNNTTEGVKIISEELNSTILSEALNTTAETVVTSDKNVGDSQETIYPTSFDVWSTLSSSSSSYGMK